MASRYRSRRRFKKRRRRRRKGSFAARVKQVMNKKNQGFRRVKISNVPGGLETPQDKCQIKPISVCADRTALAAMMAVPFESAAGGAGAQYGATTMKAGSYYDPITNAVIDPPTGSELLDNKYEVKDRYLCKFKDLRQKIIIKNTEIHPVDVVCYEIVARENRIRDGRDTNLQISIDLKEAMLSSEMRDASSSNTTIEGDSLISIMAANEGVESFDVSAHIYHRSFLKYWKVVKSASYRLQPGDEIRWNMPKINYTYSPSVLLEESTADSTEIIKNVTRALLVKVRGVLGRDPAAGGEDRAGFLSGEVVFWEQCSAKLCPTLRALPTAQLTQVNKTDLVTGAITLEDVTEHVRQVPDDP